MKLDRSSPLILDDRLSAAVPAEVRRAVERVASAQRVTSAEFVRRAVTERLNLFDIPFDPPSPASRAAPRGRR